MFKRIVAVFFIFIICRGYFFSQQHPDKFLGKKVGADGVLVKYPDIVRYFHYLDEQSDRVKVSDEGLSTLGNPIILAVISSEKNIADLPGLIEINQKLTHPGSLDEKEIPGLLARGKTFVLITCSLHASEIAATQMSMLFAHELAVTDDPVKKSYLDNVVILLMPSINPDGNIMETEWYNKYLGTPYESCRMPYLYHHYAGHDNNRDYFMLNLVESRVVNAVLHHRYFPQVFLDMHQMGYTGPRMFVPPFKDPINRNIEPLLLRETDMVGSMMALKLQEKHKEGVASAYGFDAYWPGGTKNTAWYKNVVGILTEMASARLASPIYIERNELEIATKGLAEYKPQSNFPDPWLGGWWRLGDIIDYELIAVEALVETAAKNRENFLANYLHLGQDNILKGKTQPPYGYLIPAQQWDPVTSLIFLQKMEEHGVLLYRIDSEVRRGDMIYYPGDVVIPMAQPYRRFINVMMEHQEYPRIKHMTAGPIMEPYDATGWTMPLLMGVKSIKIEHTIEDLPMSRYSPVAFPVMKLPGNKEYYVISCRLNDAVMVVNRLHKKKKPVFRYVPGEVIEESGTGSTGVQRGDYLVRVKDIPGPVMESVLDKTGVVVTGQDGVKKEMVKPLNPVIIGIYQSYLSNIDEGWTRWVLDRYEFPYKVIKNSDFTLKKLIAFDAVIIPDSHGDEIISGTPGRNRTYYDDRNLPPDFRGGIGEKGLKALVAFVEEGGTLILLDSASEIGIKNFSLPLANVLEKKGESEFSCPGSLLRIFVDVDDPLGWGMERDNFIYFSESPAFRTFLPQTNFIQRKVVAGFNESGNHLLSGYLKGEGLLDGAVMIARFAYYKGTIIVLGGRVQHRAQTYGTFKFLFNSLYYHGLKK